MDVTSLYTNIPHEEGVTTVCHAYEDFYGDKAPIPTKYLREMLYLILTENSFQFYEGTTYRPMEQLWEQRWPLLLQTSSWPE